MLVSQVVMRNIAIEFTVRTCPVAGMRLWVVAAILLAILQNESCFAAAAAVRRPNVILIMTDDQGYGDLHCHGNTMIRTPALDQLHQGSVRLTNFHVDPTCSPTRAALLTGRYSTRTGVWHTVMGRSLLHRDETTLAGIFQQQSYRTGIMGKWHLGEAYPLRPQDRGFERVLIHGGGGIGQTPDYWGNDYFDDHYWQPDGWRSFSGYCTDVFFDAAQEFIRDAGDRPFFLYLAPNVPHSPYRVPERYRDEYVREGVSEPMASFYGMITHFDDRLGRLLEALERQQLADDTLVIFLTDNGTAAGAALPKQRSKGSPTVGGATPSANWSGFNAGMRGTKGSEYDGGHRVPCFWRWPNGGLSHGRDVTQLTAHLDILPTLVELCGFQHAPQLPLDGQSLAAVLRDPEVEIPDRILFVHTQREELPPKGKHTAVMRGNWRLVNQRELYQLDQDPGQQHEVAGQHPEQVAHLQSAYEAWWGSLQPAIERFTLLSLGEEAQNPTSLNCMDWHASLPQIPWDQPQAKELPAANGWWMVDVARAGTYAFTLRHLPEPAAVPLQATSAKVMVGEHQAEVAVPAGATTVTVTLSLPQGPARLQTELLDAQSGQSRGAFFVDIELVTPGRTPE